jgi:SNF2 family DNA or RNA helicase
VVLFRQWTDFLNLLEPFLVQLQVPFVRYDGKMSVEQRNKSIIDFKTNPNVGVILVSLKAGGQGLNLCEGSVAIFADHWWNCAAEDQATDRIHRIGQTRSVDILKYTTKGTIEENVLKLQAKKRAHELALFGDEKILSRLKMEDLKLLFEIPKSIVKK